MNKVYICLATSIPLLALLWYPLAKYIAGGVCHSQARMNGKTVLITGANTGIGKETALDLAKRGARVIMACRDMAKGQSALKEIVETSGNSDIVLKRLDLASLNSIREFADDIMKTEARLDVLVNNAGVAWLSELTRTQDGFEMSMGVNHFGHFLLTNLLVGLLKRSSPSRIILVSSIAHRVAGPIDLENMNSEISYTRFMPYSQSKLANILIARELARRLAGSRVTANSLHPGLIVTELGRHFPPLWMILMSPFNNIFTKTLKQGAQTTIHLAVSEEVEDVSGLYFVDCEPKEPSSHAQDDDAAKKLWEQSADLVGLKDTI